MNVLRYIPMKAFNFALKILLKAWFKYPNPEISFHQAAFEFYDRGHLLALL